MTFSFFSLFLSVCLFSFTEFTHSFIHFFSFSITSSCCLHVAYIYLIDVISACKSCRPK